MASRRKLIKWYTDQQGRVIYSREHRNGPTSYDGASALFAALIYARFLPSSPKLGKLSTLCQLEGSLLQPIRSRDVRPGDVFISKPNQILSDLEGHTGVALDQKRIILCCQEYDGIHICSMKEWKDETLSWYRLAEPVRKRRSWLEKVQDYLGACQKRKALQAIEKINEDKKCYN